MIKVSDDSHDVGRNADTSRTPVVAVYRRLLSQVHVIEIDVFILRFCAGDTEKKNENVNTAQFHSSPAHSIECNPVCDIVPLLKC